ncbi:MAG TPA: DNA-binding response regulator [Ruminococcaceae bacterium]|nr:DNA-binding response regulator [Oscillospiraceae bacterium]
MARIVVVEDDLYMREELIDLLTKSGYEALPLSNFENAVSQIAALAPDLILLDINLPCQSGFEICKALKSEGIGTVLVLTARDKLQDELHALGLGADDYLTKPCNMDRLLARIRNLLRRTEEQERQGLLNGGSFLLDPNTFTFYVGKSSYLLPPNEGKILLTLLQRKPNIVTKAELCRALWRTNEFIDENALQVNLTRLRKTLRRFQLDDRIETIRGQGYRFREQADS